MMFKKLSSFVPWASSCGHFCSLVKMGCFSQIICTLYWENRSLRSQLQGRWSKLTVHSWEKGSLNAIRFLRYQALIWSFGLHEFSWVTLTNHHVRLLNWQKCIYPQLWVSEAPLKVWCWRATFPSEPLRGWSCLPLPALSIPWLVASQLQPLPPASHGCLLPCSSWFKISSLKDTSHIRLVYTLIQHDFIVAWLHLWRLLPQKLRFPGKELEFLDIWGEGFNPAHTSFYLFLMSLPALRHIFMSLNFLRHKVYSISVFCLCLLLFLTCSSCYNGSLFPHCLVDSKTRDAGRGLTRLECKIRVNMRDRV